MVTQTLMENVVGLMDQVAGAEVMPRWRNLGAEDIAEKTGPDDLVTVADQATEAVLSGKLCALLPSSSVVGEEAVAADPDVRQRLREPGLVWVIDPIDGTSGFAAGEPDFTIMVALVENGQLQAGWILAPALGSFVYGSAHGAIFQRQGTGDARTLARPTVPFGLQGMTGLLGRRNITPEQSAALKARERHFKALDGVTYAGIDYGRLARGEAQFAVYNKTEPWDHLPGLAILTGLGFHYARHDGSGYRPGDNTGGLLVAPDRENWSTIHKVLMR